MTLNPPLPAGHAGNAGDAGPASKTAAPRRQRRSSARSSSLLLRLFTSQFFDAWMAISYMFRYPHLVGVQHYLCNELRKFPQDEVAFFLPQLVHLLITRPNESVALESLLMDMSLQSAHVATIVYWYLQAYLSDLAPNPRTMQFKHCQRIFNQVQELLFTDIAPELIIDTPAPAQHAYLYALEHVTTTSPSPGPAAASLAARFRAMLRLAPRVRENAQAALVGIAATMASPGAPALASTMGWLAVAQAQTVRLPDRVDDSLDLAPQYHSLAGKTRGSGSPAPSRPAARSRPASYADASINAVTDCAPPPTLALLEPVHGPLSTRSALSLPPPQLGRASTYALAGSMSAGAPRATVGSRSPTPTQRLSTDSCRTVAIMEGLEPAESPPSGDCARAGNASMESCRSYLHRATRQFQRNARQIDRRLSRSSRDPQSPPGGDSFAGQGEEMDAALADMATFMEGERAKLERRAGYFGAEIKFLTALMDISRRVCAVPKAGRQQSLKAELTLFNHTLDRNACIPLWCPDSDGSHHHQIVRIPTEDTVVLNSAERAPYLLTLEILGPEDDGARADTRYLPAPTPAAASRSAAMPAAGRITAPAAPAAPLPPSTANSGRDAGRDSLPGADQPALARPGADGSGHTSTESARDAPPQRLSPTVVEDVDEKLMAEIFGDIDDVSSIPESPLSPQAEWRGAAPASTPEPASAAKAAAVARSPTSHEDIRARMRTASILLAQLARQQKALGIKVTNLVVAPTAGASDGDRRQGKLGNVTTQALVMEEIRARLVREMMQLEEIRLKQPGLDTAPGTAAAAAAGADGDQGMEDSISMHEVEFKDDPSARVLKEDWASKKARIRRTSPFGRCRNWDLLSVIVKEGADLRQEQLALQLIREMQRIWRREETGVFVKYYRIMVAGEGCGLMETITNTVSVHSIKKEFYSRNPGYSGPPYTLYNYFITSYGTPDTQRFRKAQDCFMRSLVSYSLITYILQIRDRHNGNILLDTDGHVIHIDFGFMLHNSPGSVGFEQAPFKLSMEYVDILGGRTGAKFAEFRDLLLEAFLALRKHADHVCLLVEMMAKDSPLPCLGGGQATVAALRERLHPALSEQQMGELVDSMLVSSCDNITTRMYDAFQYYSNGIL